MDISDPETPERDVTTKSRSTSIASSEFGDYEIPCEEYESLSLDDELSVVHIYDEYNKLGILK